MTDLTNIAKAIREEIVRQHRDQDRQNCPAGSRFWEEEIQPMLLAEVAARNIAAEGISR